MGIVHTTKLPLLKIHLLKFILFYCSLVHGFHHGDGNGRYFNVRNCKFGMLERAENSVFFPEVCLGPRQSRGLETILRGEICFQPDPPCRIWFLFAWS